MREDPERQALKGVRVIDEFLGMPKQAAEKDIEKHRMRPLGLKPLLLMRALRGAEAPLFHVAAGRLNFSAGCKGMP